MKSAAEPGEESRGAAEGAETDIASRLQAVAAERDLLAAEKAGLQDRILRLQAEFENFRRRVEREKGEILEFANAETVRALLPMLDDFERALKTESTDKEYARGMELIYHRLFDAMKKLGLEPIASAGETFDPHIHHAVEMVESDEHEDHAILDEYQRGYNFRGKMLRPAMVKVAVRKS
ncbi:MAG TPA: nucleotide exchange factor GrpE [Candidatus Binatia bacterium]|nr:nucleotide exchange factor GrpE [Candidatus Binatia bacterium]